LNLIFPIYCINCRKEWSWICNTCKSQIVLNKQQICPISLKPSKNGKVLINKENLYIDNILVMSEYHKNIILQKLIKQLKYKFSFDISEFLWQILYNFIKSEGLNLQEFTITSVPLHWKRLIHRWFNQSELLAKQIWKTTKLLKRVRHTPNQSKLNKNWRLKNIKNAFKFIWKTVPKKVLLIDDVSSTMSTVNECAKILKQNWVKNVYVAVLARNV